MAIAKVLIVEDEPEVAALLEFNLKTRDFQSLTAPDRLSACRIVGAEHPDAILLDLLLPDLEGWEICHMIRSHSEPSVASTPVMKLTALGSPQDKSRGYGLGADDYVPKPFTVAEIVMKVARQVERCRHLQSVWGRLDALQQEQATHANLQGLLFRELKNKLAVIGGFAKRLTQGAQTAGTVTNREYARAILDSSEYFHTLAEELLILRRIENGALDLPVGEFCAWGVAREVVQLHTREAEDRQMVIALTTGDPGARVQLNRSALKICLSNLVANAGKYSPKGARVAISVRRLETGMCLEVADNGPGIPEQERAHVFENLYRG